MYSYKFHRIYFLLILIFRFLIIRFDFNASYLKIRRVKVITKRAGVPLIINDRIDVALAIDAGKLSFTSSDIHF